MTFVRCAVLALVFVLPTFLVAGEPQAAYPPPDQVRTAFRKLLDRPRVLFNIKDHEAKREEVKAKLLMRIGDAEKALGDGYSISASAIKPTKIEAYERAGYRDFRVTVKKSK